MKGEARAPRELTTLQKGLVENLLAGMSIPVASEKAGYADSVAGYTAVRSGLVQSALREGRQATLDVTLAAKAMKAMGELLEPPTPPATRFAAAKWVLEATGHGVDSQDDGKDIPIHEMTEAQLHRFMAKAQSVVDAGGDAPLIHVVTPDDGALPALPA